MSAKKKKSRLIVLKRDWLAQEEQLLREAFEACEWSLTEASKFLSCSRSSLQAAMKRHVELDEERQELMAYGSGGGERAAKGRAA